MFFENVYAKGSIKSINTMNIQGILDEN